MSMTRGKDPKIRVYKGKEQSDPTTNHRSLPSVNSNFSLVSTTLAPLDMYFSALALKRAKLSLYRNTPDKPLSDGG